MQKRENAGWRAGTSGDYSRSQLEHSEDKHFRRPVQALPPRDASWRPVADAVDITLGTIARRAIAHHHALAADHLREAEAIRQTARRAGVLP